MSENLGKSGNGDDVATLVRLAGKRPAVAPERIERVRAAAHETWRAELRRRSRARYGWVAASLLAAASLLLVLTWPWLIGDPRAPEASIRVEASVGTAWVLDAGAGTDPADRRRVESGEAIELGSELRTSETGRVAIRLAQHSVRLDSSTRLRLLSADAIALEHGAIYVDSGMPSQAAGKIAVQTPFGVLREIGTQYEVRLDEGLMRVRLREGALIFSRQDERHDLGAGTELEVGADGAVKTRATEVYGPDWDWIVELAPPLELDGRTARWFLDRVARERGWTLAFSDEELAVRAEQTVLDGSVEGLTLDQALDAVLPTCRMVHRVEHGVLKVAPEPD